MVQDADARAHVEHRVMFGPLVPVSWLGLRSPSAATAVTGPPVPSPRELQERRSNRQANERGVGKDRNRQRKPEKP